MASKWLAEKAGDFARDAVMDMFSGGDKDEDKDDKKGGFFSKIFDRDGDEEKRKEMREKEKEDDKEGGFFSKIFDRDDDDDKKEKKSGFAGLFSEQEGAGAAGGHEGDGEEGGGSKGQSVALNDGDLFNDLMDVAEETAKGK